MSSKQFASNGDIVLPALKGLVRSNPDLTLIEKERVVFRTESKAGSTDKVTLLSGGGSGHEPTHSGFVGEGFLDAAVAGTIFASPSTKQIYAGLKAVENKKGTLIIVKNYTGDVIHFGLAAERIKAQGGKVEVVVVGDDVSVGKKQGGLVGRRGLAGTILVHKASGAAAAKGLSLNEVATVAQSVINNVVTIGASLDHCNVPGRRFETNLTGDEIEIGMGIHNESGVKKSSPVPTIPELAAELLDILLNPKDEDRQFVNFNAGKDDVVLLINNLGGISNLELSFFSESVYEQLGQKYGIIPKRLIVGTFMTALNGSGFSITLLNASAASKASGQDIISLVDAPANAPGWSVPNIKPEALELIGMGTISTAAGPETTKSASGSGISSDADFFAKFLSSGIKSVLKEEDRITLYDTIAGDGDCGETLANGGNALLEAIKDKSIRLSDAVNAISDIADIVEDSMGGTSGGLYSIFLSSLAQGVRDSGVSKLSEDVFRTAAKVALESLYKYTRARVGDRTLIDALAPFVDALADGKSFAYAVEAANKGADTTRKLEAKFGRASYVAKEELEQFDHEGGLPDPGAVGLAALFSGFLQAYQG